MREILSRILLDVGGSFYGDRTEPSFDNFDSNSFLARIGQLYTEYLTDRVAMENIIQRLGEPLSSSGWYIPVNYVYYNNDSENECFVGSVVERMKLASEEPSIDLVVRLHVTDVEEDCVYVGYESAASESVAKVFAEEFNRLEETPFDMINVIECSLHGAQPLVREIAQELRLAPQKAIAIYLGLTKDGKFVNFLSTREGENWFISCISRALDRVSKEL